VTEVPRAQGRTGTGPGTRRALLPHRDATDEAVLREAGIGRARGLICAVDSDAENVFITIVARSLSPALLIVARAAPVRPHHLRILPVG
jgi:voltage-gated potassium channel Kch